MRYNNVALHNEGWPMKHLAILFERLFAPGLEMLGNVPERTLRELFLAR